MSKSFDIKSLEGLTLDSRAVKKGYLFAALPGHKTDGARFISDAIMNGAVAILAPESTKLPEGVKGITLITDPNPRRRLALMAAEFYGRQPQTIVAVTGTNGKTSTVHFTKQLWKARGLKAASIGTLGVRGPEMIRSGSMTTPDPVSLQAALADMAASGIDHLAMEASSHGLHQYRLDGVKVAAAGFTNLTRDHLDYHKDMREYLDAKLRLFAEVMPAGGLAVLNADIPEYEQIAKIVKEKKHDVISYGFKKSDLQVLEAKPTPHGQNLKIKVFGKDYNCELPLVGKFQVMNALCALGLSLCDARDDQKILESGIAALADLQGAPGRLELVGEHPKNAAVYVDYAHTPDALENVLEALRPHTQRKLVCVFGCGGDRDAGKRPVMGGIASRLADVVIVTDDNPRSEKPAAIRARILEAAPGAREIGDRREAIRIAVRELEAGDVLIVAGKGHEQGQIFETRTDPFDDRTEAEKAMKEMNA